ncbi:MAG TPA: NAD-dependent succinate-semialdehyde dehydrogenase [Edaphobacter sp.]
MAIESINPANGKLLRSFEALTEEAIAEKLALAAETFRTFPAIPLEQRALWMNKLASLLEQEADEIAPTLTLEMGKPIHAARQEVLKCATACRYYAENAARILAPEPIATENSSYLRWDPIGPVLAIMPWNFPFWQVFRFLAPALMAGNVGLLKHSPNVPQCALLIESLVRRAGFPRGSFQSLLIETEQTAAVLADPRVAAVTLTGSVRAGMAVAEQAGRLIKKSVLELGGSDPFIVLPSCDLDAAVETAVRARLINNGQSCIAAKRFIIHEAIYDAFEQRFIAGMEAMKIGDPMKEDTDIGPLSSAKAAETLEQQVNDAIAAGARVLTGGQRMLGEGNYFEPTALTDIPRTSVAYREELFGPVAMLFKVSTIDEAIEIANDTPYGLGASAWTREPAEQQRLIAEIQAGAVFINAMVASDPRLPFGGIKHSGYGRELHALGMREFLNAKTVVLATSR